MTVIDPFQRFEELQAYIGWSSVDAERVARVGRLVDPHLPALIDDFYAEIERHPDAARVITGGAKQVARLKTTLLNWIRELFCGNYDRDYAVRRWKAGHRHVEIGLNQVYVNAALSRLRLGLIRVLEGAWTADPQGLKDTVSSLNGLLDLDLALVQDAYETEYSLRLMHSERLAAIGRFTGGVAHELRNPLNVIKTSVYYLLNAQRSSPEKTAEHLSRIERQVGLADSVITTLSSFAKLAAPDLRPVPVAACVEQSLPGDSPPPGIEMVIDCPPSLPAVMIDFNQMRIALGNLIRNALEAMPGGGRLSIIGRQTECGVELALIDTGVGITPENMLRIMEPFHSTKPRGIGLGLAMARAIIDKNRGRLKVASVPGKGSTFTVTLTAEA